LVPVGAEFNLLQGAIEILDLATHINKVLAETEDNVFGELL
jgi:hypothetical protein